MTDQAVAPPMPPPPPKAPALDQTLRKLFLTLFLRGRSARGMRKGTAPTSIWQKLGLILLTYAVIGFMAAFGLMSQPLFATSLYLHGLTFVFLGMFVASSAGEILFNKEESDILLHRPIAPRTMLWAKIRVLLEVSLWLAGAFNLAGFIAGVLKPDGSWLYPFAHAASTILEAGFCTGCVILAYQLCLRWLGRERLEGVMTMAQVLMAVGFVMAGQILPRMMMRMNVANIFNPRSWWIDLMPPAWFAGIDDALAGSHSGNSWALAGLGVIVSASVVWLAFGKLAGSYQSSVQAISETASPRPRKRGRRRMLDALVHAPPLSWLLREPVSRASFLLSTAYLLRDRDVKLRIYPGLAPMMVWPILAVVSPTGPGGLGLGSFGIGFASVYLGILPMMGVSMLQYSQQWQASDVFRAAPISGPGPLCDGARWAVLCVLGVPALMVVALLAVLIHGLGANLLLLLPGLVLLPVYTFIPCLVWSGVPLSLPTEESKSVGRGLLILPVMFVAMAVAAVALWAKLTGWFWWFMLGETVIAAIAYKILSGIVSKSRWTSME